MSDDKRDWTIPVPHLEDKDTNVTHSENYRPKKQPEVWECECGGQRFWLQKDGFVVCTACGRERPTLIWGYRT